MAGTSIADNLGLVRDRIDRAARASGRTPDDVRLIAVSKTKPLSMIEEAMRAGQRSFGENYVQEGVAKAETLPQADWHFIGSLQTNKVKHVVGRFALVHSVDSLKLANKINEIAKTSSQSGSRQNVLLQVNIGGEASKHGASIDEAWALLEHMSNFESLRVCGLMSLPPLSDDERTARRHFAILREAFEKFRSQMSPALKSDFAHLSIGTSSDYEWAILEGATMVRVGTAIFGEREYRAKA